MTIDIVLSISSGLEFIEAYGSYLMLVSVLLLPFMLLAIIYFYSANNNYKRMIRRQDVIRELLLDIRDDTKTYDQSKPLDPIKIRPVDVSDHSWNVGDSEIDKYSKVNEPSSSPFVYCPACGQQETKGRKYCSKCGHAFLQFDCQACGFPNHKEADRCIECGILFT